jgi:crotonobetainyl-CoA:carnitine CoA-transferase CaiB-like acyl-CoA transferase
MTLLDGYRVLDLSDSRGLMAGRILADLGAEVVQVEPAEGSSARSAEPLAGETSYLWRALAANRRAIALDLVDEVGRDQLRALVERADVLIDSRAPAGLARAGLDWPDLEQLNDRLVFLSLTPFGRTGPKAGYADSDLVLWAAGGPLEPHREGDRPPVRPSIPQAYLLAAADGAAGVLLALIARETTGRGQLVDVSVQACLPSTTLGSALSHVLKDDREATDPGMEFVRRVDRSGSGSASLSATRKWEVLDGLVEFHIGMGPAAGNFSGNFFRWMLAEGEQVQKWVDLDWRLVADRIESGEFTDEQVEEARGAIRHFLAGKTKAEVLEAAVRYKLLSVPIFTTKDLAASVQLAARDFYQEVGKGNQAARLPGQPSKVSPAAFSIIRSAPRLGQHTEEVLAEWAAASVAPDRPSEGGPAETTPLAGLKVLDLTWVVAGPVMTRALADFGATVVRLESSKKVETARFMPPFIDGVVNPERSGLYQTWNVGKFGVTVNLQTEEGREIVRDLARWADVVLESFSPGTMDRWGLGYETLSKGRDDLIMVSTSLNGQSGPMAKLAGFGNLGAALSGFQEVVGWADRLPLGPYGPYTDFVGPRLGLATLLGCLLRRRRTGQGGYIDISQVESGVYFQAPELAEYFDNGRVAQRIGNRDRALVPHGVYRAADEEIGGRRVERFVAIAVTDEDAWPGFAEWLGRGDLAADPALASAQGRRSIEDELDRAIEAATRARTAAQCERELQQLGVAAHLAASARDLAADEQLAHRGHLVTLAHPEFGEVVVEAPRYQLSATPGRVERAAPTMGQDNRRVFTEIAGYTEERIAELEQGGVLA